MVWHMPGAEYDPKEKWYNSEDCWLLFMFEHIFSIPEVGGHFMLKCWCSGRILQRPDGLFKLCRSDNVFIVLQDVIKSWEKKKEL